MSAPYGDTTGYSFTEGALVGIVGQLREAEKRSTVSRRASCGVSMRVRRPRLSGPCWTTW
ncbi:hypothetical protein [Amycolatopsis sp. WGS_07]|uniref:hypothetical protein n=1 Tax=Amycolatopsis sp. WGS_07 TaxID=3076764 RepID=UPI00387325A0